MGSPFNSRTLGRATHQLLVAFLEARHAPPSRLQFYPISADWSVSWASRQEGSAPHVVPQ